MEVDRYKENITIINNGYFGNFSLYKKTVHLLKPFSLCEAAFCYCKRHSSCFIKNLRKTITHFY